MSEVLTQSIRDTMAVSEAMKLIALGALHGGSLITGAEQFVESEPRSVHALQLRQAIASVELYQKAIAPASTTDVGYAGALLPPAMWEPLVRRIQAGSVLGKISVPVPPTIPIPYESAAPAMTWIPENGPTPVTKITLATVTAAPFKFGGILVQTKELVKSTAQGSTRVLSARLVQASSLFVDQQLLLPTVTAVAGKNPASLTAGVTVTPPGATTDDTIAALTAAFYAARPQPLAPTFVLSPATASKINGNDKHRDLLVTGGSLNGIPAVVTNGAGANLILLDAEAIYGFDGGADVVPSQDATIEMEATPASPAVAATVMVPLWSSNLIGLRLIRVCGWAKAPGSVQFAVIA